MCFHAVGCASKSPRGIVCQASSRVRLAASHCVRAHQFVCAPPPPLGAGPWAVSSLGLRGTELLRAHAASLCVDVCFHSPGADPWEGLWPLNNELYEQLPDCSPRRPLPVHPGRHVRGLRVWGLGRGWGPCRLWEVPTRPSLAPVLPAGTLATLGIVSRSNVSFQLSWRSCGHRSPPICPSCGPIRTVKEGSA